MLAAGHGRRPVKAADAPCFGTPVLIVWLKRMRRCAETDCAVQTRSETHQLIAPRGRAHQPRCLVGNRCAGA